MPNQQRPRILYYCQSLVGIGHLTASLHIIEALSEYFDVDLIYGGIDYANVPTLPGFRILKLPALLFDDSGKLYSPDHTLTIDGVWRSRQAQILQFCVVNYQAIVFEFYPFGRRRFKKEISALIDFVRERSGDIPLFSQIREILIPSDLPTEEKIVDEINSQFHSVLVRGDPDVIHLDETFSLAHKFGDRLFYGGYISAPPPPDSPQRLPQILVSQGGGNVGLELLTSAIQVAPYLPVYSFLIVTGSKTSNDDLKYLHSLVRSNNVKISPFLNDFRQHLLTSALSINMGGDNTLLDVIATRTPSLAYPYPGNSEQALRIGKLAERGWLTKLDQDDLNPLALRDKIRLALTKPYPEAVLNLNGAINICNKIREALL